MKSRCAHHGSRFATVGVLAMDLGFARRGFAAMGLGFARCGSFFLWWALLTVTLFSGGGGGNGLWSGFMFTVGVGYVVGLVSSSMVHGVGHDGSRCGSWL